MQPIGIFDSGYGGLTVFKAIAAHLPQYDYIYLGDNGRAPYGNRSFETIHQYTWECVQWFFAQGCPLVILACNTASAKALRTIQQQDLPQQHADKRVLGVIRPTAEVINDYTQSRAVGVLGTKGTVNSGSYELEIHRFAPDVTVYQQACPMWVPLVENGEYESEGADYFVRLYLDKIFAQSTDIDTLLLACTHYPLLAGKIRQAIPENITLLSQGDIVAESLADYLLRHPDMETRITRTGTRQFFTTDDTADFDQHATAFFGAPVTSGYVHLP